MNSLVHSYLSNAFQKKDFSMTKVIPLITGTKLHLQNIANQCGDVNSDLQKNVRWEIMEEFAFEVRLIADEDKKNAFKGMKIYCDSVIEEIEERFNDKSIDIMIFASRFETFQSLTNLPDIEVRKFCDRFPMFNAEGVLADLKSFIFYINSMFESEIFKADKSPLSKILEADVGYCELQKLSLIHIVIPVTIASVKRSFSTMNRILSKTRNRMLPETLMHCMMTVSYTHLRA